MHYVNKTFSSKMGQAIAAAKEAHASGGLYEITDADTIHASPLEIEPVPAAPLALADDEGLALPTGGATPDAVPSSPAADRPLAPAAIVPSPLSSGADDSDTNNDGTANICTNNNGPN